MGAHRDLRRFSADDPGRALHRQLDLAHPQFFPPATPAARETALLERNSPMAFRTVYGRTISENGWRVCDAAEIDNGTLPGTSLKAAHPQRGCEHYPQGRGSTATSRTSPIPAAATATRLVHLDQQLSPARITCPAPRSTPTGTTTRSAFPIPYSPAPNRQVPRRTAAVRGNDLRSRYLGVRAGRGRRGWSSGGR
jgi:hypothetical protein